MAQQARVVALSMRLGLTAVKWNDNVSLALFARRGLTPQSLARKI